MEYRIILTKDEAFKVSQKLLVRERSYIKDTYTGTKRIRIDETGVIREKEYKTPVKGVICRFASKGDLDGIEVWFEYKWAEESARFEMEFEGDVPDEFQGRKNITGWDILK